MVEKLSKATPARSKFVLLTTLYEVIDLSIIYHPLVYFNHIRVD